MGKTNQTLRIVLLVALVVGSLTALFIVFALLGWWAVIFRSFG